MNLDRAEAERLVTAHDKLAWQAAHWGYRLAGRRGDLADYYQAAAWGLWDAATRYDPSRGFAFATYADPWTRVYVRQLARQEAARGLRATRRHGWVRPVVTPLSAFDRDGDDRPIEFAAPADPPADGGELWPVVGRLVPHDRQREAVRLCYRRELSDRQVAAAMGVNRSRVHQLRAAGLAHLRRRAAELAVFLT